MNIQKGENMVRKIAIVSFQGEMPCFVHAILNVWNYHERGYETALIVEGASTKLLLTIADSPQGKLWQKIKDAGLIKSVCKACAIQMGSLTEAELQGLPIDAALSGHSDLERFTKDGYELILF
jgi:hypothetical protein